MDGVTTPAIGPTALRWWHGSRLTLLPDSKSATASSGSSTRPSSAAPPMSAPRSGPDVRSHSIGGPAWRNWPGSRPSTSEAGATSTRWAVTPSIASTALPVGLGAARVGGDRGQVGLGARHRRAPVDALDGDGLAGHGVGEHAGADGDDGGLAHWNAPISSRARRVAAALERWTSAPAATRASRWAARPCGSRSVPTRLTITGIGRSARAAAMAGASSRGRVGLGAVAEHEVEQDHAGGRVGGGPGQLLVAQRRVDHRVRAALGEGVVTEVDHRVGVGGQVAVQREVVGQRDVAADRAEHLRGHQHRLVAEGAADEEPAEQGPGRGAGVCRRPRTGHVGRRRGRAGASTASATAVRSRWPRPSRPSSTGVASVVDVRLEVRGHLGGRRLGDHHDQVDVGVGVEPAQRLAGREPADRRRQVATADAERVAYADPVAGRAGVVEQARAAAGSRCRRRRRCRSGRGGRRWRSPARRRR